MTTSAPKNDATNEPTNQTMNQTMNEPTHSDFVRDLVRSDLETGKHTSVVTRFPPEPNGYLHIGHAKSICLNFGVAEEFGGRCHLRFDDTNPATESDEYVQSIQRDVRWLGFDWGEHLYHASDYFPKMYEYAEHLIREGKAYVDSLNTEEIREYRGTVGEPGKESPYRNRSVEENLDLFRRMRAGEFEDGTHVLRAKIDMAANNMLMRDPLLFRIRKMHHYRTGDGWPIYPMYDYAHCLEDALEQVTHSLCTLEFENNRELYDWVIENTPVPSRPRQYEFARLNLNYTVMSKRKLLQLVQEGHVTGWDDPRMLTLSGLRRRGYTPSSIRAFCERVGVAKTHNVIDMALLEFSIRDDLNLKVQRVLGVLRPLKVVIENYPEDQVEELEAPYYPRDVPKEGSRHLPFSREIYIEQDDFMEEPTKGYFRLAPGREVRLRYAYIIRCVDVVKNGAGDVVEVRCTYDPETRGGNTSDGRRVKGTVHWVSAAHAVTAEVRLYDRLFTAENPGTGDTDFLDQLNPHSLQVLSGCRLEPGLASAKPGDAFQFERQGYFTVDQDSTPDALVFNRTVTLRDTWAKIAGKGAAVDRKQMAARKAKKKEAIKKEQREAVQSRNEEAPERILDARQQTTMERYRDTLGLPEHDARLLASDDAVAAFFEEALTVHEGARAVANWVLNELLRELKGRSLEEIPFGGKELGELAALVDTETISGTSGKEVFAEMLASGGTPAEIVEVRGLRQLTETSALEPVVTKILAENGGQVAAYRAGKTALLGFFIGQVMRATGGRANAQAVREILMERLKAEG